MKFKWAKTIKDESCADIYIIDKSLAEYFKDSFSESSEIRKSSFDGLYKKGT
jgi:hypothetical protein